MTEKILPEIEKYNAVNHRTHEIPWYDATKMERKIELYFGMAGDIIILGRAGERYIYWLSVTKVEDVALNEQIYTRIANEPLAYVTRLEKALEDVNLTCSDLDAYYRTELKWKTERRHKNEVLANWETPFGHCYTKEDAEKNGAVFARDVKAYAGILRERCELRECDGCYAVILQKYAEELKVASEYTDRIRGLHGLLQEESYLLLSKKEEIKKWYCYCYARCDKLENK